MGNPPSKLQTERRRFVSQQSSEAITSKTAGHASPGETLERDDSSYCAFDVALDAIPTMGMRVGSLPPATTNARRGASLVAVTRRSSPFFGATGA